MGILGEVNNELNHQYVNAAFMAAVGAGLGWVKPEWFGSASQAATMAAIGSLATILAATAANKGVDSPPVTLLALVITELASPKAASFLGYETTWQQSLSLGAAGIGSIVLFEGEPNFKMKMHSRIQPAVWAALGFGAGKLFPQWITPIDGAMLMGIISLTDLTLSHAANYSADSSDKDDSPTLKRAVVGMALLAALTSKFYPNNWKTVAVGAGIFYAQQAVRS